MFYPEDNGREGLYVNVAAVFVRFLGHEAWVLRLPAAIFGILTVWGVYPLAAELESETVGLLAAFFLATSFWHVLLSREAFRAIGGPLFLVWGMYLLLVALRRRHRGIAILAGLVYGLGFYTYIAYRATPLLVAAVLLRAARRGGGGRLRSVCPGGGHAVDDVLRGASGRVLGADVASVGVGGAASGVGDRAQSMEDRADVLHARRCQLAAQLRVAGGGLLAGGDSAGGGDGASDPGAE